MNGHKHARLIPGVLDLDLSALSLPDNRVRPPVGPVVNLIRQSIILRRFFFFCDGCAGQVYIRAGFQPDPDSRA